MVRSSPGPGGAKAGSSLEPDLQTLYHMETTMELDDDDLELLKNQPSVWDTWIDAMQHHIDWNPDEPELSLAIIQGTEEGTRL